jgi:hypothetical protein
MWRLDNSVAPFLDPEGLYFPSLTPPSRPITRRVASEHRPTPSAQSHAQPLWSEDFETDLRPPP